MGTFTTISSSPITAPHAAALMGELQLSMEERTGDVEASISFDSFAGLEMIEAFGTFFTQFKAGAAALISPAPILKYFVNSSFQGYADIDEVLDDAGHGSGWITIDGDSTIADMETAIQQMQDVLLELVHYRFTLNSPASGGPAHSGKFTITSPGNNGVREDSDADEETAWDNAVADAYDNSATSLLAGWSGTATTTVTLWGPVIHATYNLSALNLHGIYEKAVLAFALVNGADPGPPPEPPISSVDFSVTMSGDSDIIDTFDETDTGGNTITYTPAGDDPEFSDDIDIDFEITTSEPADFPWAAGGGLTWIVLGFDGFAIFFDSDGEYTHG